MFDITFVLDNNPHPIRSTDEDCCHVDALYLLSLSSTSPFTPWLRNAVPTECGERMFLSSTFLPSARVHPNDVILQSLLSNVGPRTAYTSVLCSKHNEQKSRSFCLRLATLIPPPAIFITINNKSTMSLFCISTHSL